MARSRIRCNTSFRFSADMVARTEFIGLMSIACFSLATCSRLRTISPVGICATPTFGGGGTTIPPDGNVTGWILSTACLSKSMPTAAAAAVLAIFSNVLAMWSRPLRCHLVRGLPFNVLHPFFSFRGNLIRQSYSLYLISVPGSTPTYSEAVTTGTR